MSIACTREQRRQATADLTRGLSRYSLWLNLGWHSVRQRYRRSLLGPLWITVSMGIFIGALGILYGQLFGRPLAEYLPYLAVGFLVWGFMSTSILDGAKVFLQSSGIIKQVNSPLSGYVFQLLWSNLIIFFHNIWIYVGLAIWFQIDINPSIIFAIPGLALIVLNLLWMVVALGLVSARFRDIPLMLQSIMQLLFFLTPVIWKPEMLPGRSLLLDGNPFYHLLQLVRQPLLGEGPGVEHWLVGFVLLACGSGLTFWLYGKYRARIPYWV